MDAHGTQFLFVSTSSESEGDARISHPRLAVIARKRSSAKFVQSYVDVGELSGRSMANKLASPSPLLAKTVPCLAVPSPLHPLTHTHTHHITTTQTTGAGTALANAATSVKCERRSEVQHLHVNELGPKGQLFDAVSVGTRKMAAYKNVLINVGGETARVNFQATLNGTMGSVEVCVVMGREGCMVDGGLVDAGTRG